MNFIRINYILWCVLVIGAAACSKKDYNATPDQPTLNQYIQGGNGLTLFRQALHRTGLDSVLGNGGPYTVFAPVDSAFLAAGLSSDKISSYPPDQLRNIISMHILPGRIGNGTLPGFLSDSLQTLNPRWSPVVTQNYYGMFLNGVKVTQGNINLADGVLHKLSGVCIPPTGDILATLDSLPNTKMAAYIIHNSAGLTVLAKNVLSLFTPVPPQGGYHSVDFFTANLYNSTTMLIPSDDAFRQYGYNSVSDLAALDTVDRTNMLTSCILFSSYMTCDLMGGRIVGNLYSVGNGAATPNPPIPDFGDNGNIAWVDSHNQQTYQNLYNNNGQYEFARDGLTILGTGITASPRIIQPNIITTTGVIHIIDHLFEPNGSFVPVSPQ